MPTHDGLLTKPSLGWFFVSGAERSLRRYTPRVVRALVVTFVCVLASGLSAPVGAQGFAGDWEASALRIQNTTRSWGPDCPTRLPASQSEPGGRVRVTQSGDHLTFSGAVSGSTQRCWSEVPSIRRISSRVQGGTWTIVCRTPEEEAQGESGRYTVRAEGDQLVFEESTEWDWRLRDSQCTASRRARRTFTRVGAPVATMEPEPEPQPTCTAGPAAGVRLSPASGEIAPGERVCFRARVVDRSGCTVRGAPLELRMRHAAGLQGTLDGRCFTASSAAAEAEGEYRIEARSGAFSASATVTVQSEDLSELTARRENNMASSSGDAESGEASDVEARALAGATVLPWLLGSGAALLLLLGAGLFLWGRRKGPRTDEADEAPPSAPSESSVAFAASPSIPSAPVAAAPIPAPPVRPKLCPACGFEERGPQRFCPNDGVELIDVGDPAVRAKGMICPQCRRGYGADVTRCTADQTALVPYVFYVAKEKHKAAAKRVCPTCGKSYGPETTFCGADGTPLPPPR